MKQDDAIKPGAQWDSFQREALAELGLRNYVLAGANDQAVRAPSVDVSPALQQALMRAAGGSNEALDVVAALPLDSVQGRRAAWPRLRRLRARAQ